MLRCYRILGVCIYGAEILRDCLSVLGQMDRLPRDRSESETWQVRWKSYRNLSGGRSDVRPMGPRIATMRANRWTMGLASIVPRRLFNADVPLVPPLKLTGGQTARPLFVMTAARSRSSRYASGGRRYSRVSKVRFQARLAQIIKKVHIVGIKDHL